MTVSNRLTASGVGVGSVVALAAVRSIETISGMLGTSLAGAAYVPVDLDFPESRTRYMLEVATVRAAVGAGERARAMARMCGVPCVDASSAAKTAVGTSECRDLSVLDTPCYVMFTSGSTGEPKGVVHHHRSLSNLIRWQLRDSRCGERSRTLQFAPLTFDVSFQEVFATLCAGGTLVLPARGVREDPERLWELLVDSEINRLFLPSVALQTLAAFATPARMSEASLREVISAGEQLQCGDAVRRLFAGLENCELVNQYGPTETHVVTSHRLSGRPHTWPPLPPIGRAIDNVTISVRNADGHEVPAGERGELHVAGAAVAAGYVNRPDLTADRFTAACSPHAEYRTGDIAHSDDEGLLWFAGRLDDQMKIAGFRVEPGEVEAAVLAIPGVVECVALGVGSPVATAIEVVVATGDRGPAAADEIVEPLRSVLPAHLIPVRVSFVDALPLTASGKVDRVAVRDRLYRTRTLA